MEKRYTLQPQYIRYTDTEFEGKRLHSFQAALMSIHEQKEECLIISAPTGAGKTYGFGLPTIASKDGLSGRSRTLIISPTNALIKQTFNDLNEEWGDRLRVENFSAKDIKKTGLWRPQEILQRIRDSVITVTNPDLISLVIAGQYYRWTANTSRMRQWSDIQKNIQTVIFDEYHLYSEEELAKILSFMALARGTGNTDIRYAFASATPNEKLKALLTEFGFSFRESGEEMVRDAEGDTHFRKSKGAVTLTFTDEHILDSIEDEVPPRGKRTLFLFDRVIGCERGIERLQTFDVGKEDWKEYTGFETRAQKKQNANASEDAPYIMATSAAEQGLNLEVGIAHIEPGRYLENFWQRFGRAARRGKNGTVIVHTLKEKVSNLPDEINGYSELGEAMEKLMSEKETYATRVFIHAGAYLYLVYQKAGNQALKEQVWNVGNGLPGTAGRTFRIFNQMEKLLKELKRKAKRSPGVDARAFIKWWHDYLQAFGWFRGQSESVSVILPRSDRKATETDIRWLKRWCDYREVEEENEMKGKKTVFEVIDYRDNQRELIMAYEGPDGPVSFRKEQIWRNEAMREKWKKIIEDFLDDAFEDKNGLERVVEEIQRILPYVLAPIHINLLKPVEVQEVADDPFL